VLARSWVVIAVLCGLPAAATERSFGYAWDSAVLPSGAKDVQAWVSGNAGRLQTYTRIDLRMQATLSVANRLETSLLLEASPIGLGNLGENAVEARMGSLWRLRLLDRASDPLGLAVLGALTLDVDRPVKADSFELELRAIVDKDLGALRSVLNANLTLGRMTRVEQNLGVGYRLLNGFQFGVELRNRAGWDHGTFTGMAFGIGPSLTWRGPTWWLVLSFLPQVSAIKPASELNTGDPLSLTDNERWNFRLAFGLAAP